ncbi:MAG: CCA tRNA nucleotidyltransferase, partial [Bryobacteraceae bacterium]
IMTRLRFSNEETTRVELLVANHMRFLEAPRMRESTLKRFLRLPDFPELLELHRLDRSNGNGDLSTWEFAKRRFESLPAAELSPARLLTGSDLIAAGYCPGPEFSKMLDAAEDAQLESRIHTRDEALELIRAEFGPPPRTC